MGDVAILTKSLSKHFGELQAVKGIDLCVPAGEITSLLGPNGAGKSTTISMLACLLRPDLGRCLGHGAFDRPGPDGGQARHRPGAPGHCPLCRPEHPRKPCLLGQDVRATRQRRSNSASTRCSRSSGCRSAEREAVAKFSGGMKRRVNIGIALMHRPRLLILDEPTVGIDPQSRRHILDSVKELNQAGMTVLYTTHYMEEAQELSHRIAIMDQGQVIAEGTHDELVRIVGEFDRVELTVSGDAAQAAQALAGPPRRAPITPADCRDEAAPQGDGAAAVPGSLRCWSKTVTGAASAVRGRRRRWLTHHLGECPGTQPRGRVPAPHRPRLAR